MHNHVRDAKPTSRFAPNARIKSTGLMQGCR